MQKQVTNLSFFSNYKRKLVDKVTEVVERSQLGCIGSGTKLLRQKKGCWSLGERKAKGKHLGESGGGQKGPALLLRGSAHRTNLSGDGCRPFIPQVNRQQLEFQLLVSFINENELSQLILVAGHYLLVMYTLR